jgi:hypothetical protein
MIHLLYIICLALVCNGAQYATNFRTLSDWTSIDDKEQSMVFKIETSKGGGLVTYSHESGVQRFAI